MSLDIPSDFVSPFESRNTHEANWQLDYSNRPSVNSEIETTKTTNKPHESGLVIRQPL